MTGQPHVFLDELPWDVRSRNTDWRYVKYALPQLSRYEPELQFTEQRSRWVSLAGNLKAVRAAVGWRVGMPLSEYALSTSKLAAGELKRCGANVVFAHRAFPLNAGDVPVVWQSAIIDPEMQRAYGMSAAALQEQIEVRGALFAKAAAVQVSTEAEARRHAVMFPALAGRFVGVPFFTPHVQACAADRLERHWDAGPVRVLFVGNNARRKGLDVLLEAFQALPATVQRGASLTVVSNFDRSAIKVPANERIVVKQGCGVEQVMAEMASAHVLVNVARLESYGLVFHEAMSQGLACLGPDWEVQRELFDDGAAGMNLACDAGALRVALEEVITDASRRYSLGRAAWERFQLRYAPAVVAARYAELFRGVAAQA